MGRPHLAPLPTGPSATAITLLAVLSFVVAHSLLYSDAYVWRLYVRFVAWFATGRVPLLGVNCNEFTNTLLGERRAFVARYRRRARGRARASATCT